MDDYVAMSRRSAVHIARAAGHRCGVNISRRFRLTKRKLDGFPSEVVSPGETAAIPRVSIGCVVCLRAAGPKLTATER